MSIRRTFLWHTDQTYRGRLSAGGVCDGLAGGSWDGPAAGSAADVDSVDVVDGTSVYKQFMLSIINHHSHESWKRNADHKSQYVE